MKTKVLLWCVVSILTAGTAQNSDQLPKSERPQVIQLSDGTKLKLLGTTDGTYHVAPQYERLGTGNWIRSTSNSMVVWIEANHESKSRPSYELLVSDEANTACIGTEVTGLPTSEMAWMCKALR